MNLLKFLVTTILLTSAFYSSFGECETVFYITPVFDHLRIDSDTHNNDFNTSNNYPALAAGISLLPQTAIQVEEHHLEENNWLFNEGLEIEYYSIALLGEWPLSKSFNLYGKIAYTDWHASYSAPRGFFDSSDSEYDGKDDDQDIMLGLGLRWQIVEWFSLLAEVNHLKISPVLGIETYDINTDIVSIGTRFSF